MSTLRSACTHAAHVMINWAWTILNKKGKKIPMEMKMCFTDADKQSDTFCVAQPNRTMHAAIRSQFHIKQKPPFRKHFAIKDNVRKRDPNGSMLYSHFTICDALFGKLFFLRTQTTRKIIQESCGHLHNSYELFIPEKNRNYYYYYTEVGMNVVRAGISNGKTNCSQTIINNNNNESKIYGYLLFKSYHRFVPSNVPTSVMK